MSSYADTIDVAEVFRSLRRGWRIVAGATLFGILAAALIVAVGPRRFTGKASVLIRDSNGGSSLLAKIGVATGNTGGGLLGMATKSPIETETQVLQSREVAGAVVDSLMLQARVRSPRSRATSDFVSQLSLPGSFAPETYYFRAQQDGSVDVTGDDFQARGKVGAPIKLPVGEITLRRDAKLPPELKLKLYDREDAITTLDDNLTVEKAGGDVASLAFRAPDSLTAARVPNMLLQVYFERRHTVDRGVNEHRAEFLALQTDSVGRVLTQTERQLRDEQDRTGVLEPEISARLGIEANGKLREDLTSIKMEVGALDRLLAQVASGRVSAREIAAYPAFIKSSGVSQLLAQLSQLDVERQKMLATRTPQDPQNQAIEQSIKDVEGQLVPIATTYRASLVEERAKMDAELDSSRTAIAALPAAAQHTQHLQQDVLRLGEIYGALQASLIEARLAAIGEGGDVHQLDIAQPPRKVSFPTPPVTMGIGMFGGLFIGMVLALFGAAFGRYVHDPLDIERRIGVPAMQLESGAPILVAGDEMPQTVLLVPIDAFTDTAGIAQRLVRTGISRALNPAVLDLTGTGARAVDGSGLPAETVSSSIARLEKEHELVIVRLPGMASDTAAAAFNSSRPVLLAATPGRVDRSLLRQAVQTLGRLSIPCLGVVLSRSEQRALRGA